MLGRMLQARLPPEVIRVYLANPSVSADEILQAIAHELELALPAGAGHLEAMQYLTAFLLDCHAQGRQVVLFVEESQSMPIATLEEIRLLSNLETDRHKLLQIVLFGQPELDALLRKPEIRQLRERITHSFSLGPLSIDDIGLYLNFRLRAAGYHGPDLFGPRVVKRIAQASAGLTRRINLLGDKTLLAAFAESTHALAPRHVQAAIRDSEFAQAEPTVRRTATRRTPWLVAGAAVVCAGVAAVAWQAGRHSAAPASIGAASAPGGASMPATSTVPTPATTIAGTVQPAAPGAGTGPSSPVPGAAAGAPASAPTPPPVTAPQAVGGPTDARPAAASPAAAAPTAASPTAASPAAASPAAAAPAAAASATASPATSTAPSPATTATADGSLLEARLLATREWLKGAAPETVSIQIMGGRDDEQLERQLRSLARQLDGERLYVFRTRAGERPALTVMYGAFDSRSAAQQALAALPAPVRAFSPHLRTVNGVRTEMARAGS
jgi:MSHA biogenesis protein MshM